MVFQVHRTMDVHIEVYTITAGRPCTWVLIPLLNYCDILLFRNFKTQRKRLYKQLFTIILQRRRRIMLVINTQNNSRFSNSITHRGINTINYHYNIGMHYRKVKQRVSSHLNTNSRLSNFRKKYEKTNSITLYKINWH